MLPFSAMSTEKSSHWMRSSGDGTTYILSGAELAKALGVAEFTVSRIKKRLGIDTCIRPDEPYAPLAHRKLSRAEVKRIMESYYLSFPHRAFPERPKPFSTVKRR